MGSLEQRMPRCSYLPKNRLLMTFLRVDQAKAMYVASLKTWFLYSCACIVPYSNQLTFFILNVLTEGVQLRRRHGRRRAFRACPCSGEDKDRPPSTSCRSGAQHGSRWIQQPYQQQQSPFAEPVEKKKVIHLFPIPQNLRSAAALTKQSA